MTESKKLKVGVIGLGIGRHHVSGFNENSNSTVVAIADLNKDILKEIGDQNGVEHRYTDPQELLEKEDLDIVSIATPNKFHKPLALAALKKGAHVFCEKPMAMNAEEAREMLAAAKIADRRIMIDFSFRFTPQSWQLKKEVDAGTLGDIYYADTRWLRRRGLPGFGGWFGKKSMSGGGPLIDLGVHRLDLALWLMGYPKPTWVMGSTYNPIASRLAKEKNMEFDVEDFATAVIKFDTGATLNLTASWASNIKEAELMETRLLGTKGGLVQRNRNGGYDFEAELYIERNGSQFNMQPDSNTSDVPTAVGHFADCITNNTPHTATGEEGLIVMELLDAIYAGAEKNEPIKL
jgi:predicted dehydrogenase